ncbi:MAG: tetratricopeptide repeat protein [Bacteroidetes bacterium]|nr:tetratricopeptide repeat protein [Bacteroidota bacterium]
MSRLVVSGKRKAFAFAFAFSLIFSISAVGQLKEIDSLRTLLSQTPKGEKHVDLQVEIAFHYTKISSEKSASLATTALDEATLIGYQKGIGDCYNVLGVANSIRGAFKVGLDYFLKALKAREEAGNFTGAAKVLNNIAGVFSAQREYKEALVYSERSLMMLKEKTTDKKAVATALLSRGQIYQSMGDTAQALGQYRQALADFSTIGEHKRQGETLLSISSILQSMEKNQLALDYAFNAMSLIDVRTDNLVATHLYLTIGQLYADEHKDQTTLHYFYLALAAAKKCKAISEQIAASQQLSSFFESKKMYDSALFYQKEYAQLSNETYSSELAGQLAFLEKEYETQNKDRQLAQHQQEIISQRWIIASIAFVLLFTVVVAGLTYRNYVLKKKANEQLHQLNKQVSEQNEEISLINENLEKEAQRRTEKIRLQNEKLIEYAFFNAHRVRGPLARVLGLTMLIEKDLPANEIKDLSKKVQASAQELDEVVREISRKLDEE